MSEPQLVVYAGVSEHDGLSDLIPGPDVARLIRRSDGVIVRDPLSFPWEVLASCPPIPMVVDLSNASADDLAALGPVLSSLTRNDVLFGDRTTVEHFCLEHDLPNLWARDDLDVVDHAVAVGAKKIADVEERTILEHIGRLPECVAVQVSGEAIRSARSGFADLVETVRRDTPGLEHSTIHTIWGIRVAPGAPLERAVLAFSTSPSTVAR